MKCLLCNYENSEDSRFCCGCGSPIPRCPTCGRVLTTRDRFCMYDGTMLPDELLMLVPDVVDTFEEVDVEQTIGAIVQKSLAEEVEMPVQTPGKAFCVNCGTLVREGEQYCADCQRAMAAPVCASCGMPCAPGEDYCTYCRPHEPVPVMNMDFEAPASPRKTSGKKKKKRGSWMVAILVLLLLLLIGVAVVMFAAESGLIELPGIFASDDADDDKDNEKEDDGDSPDAGEQKPGEDIPEDPSGGSSEDPSEKPSEKPTEEPTVAPTEETTEDRTEEPTEPVDPTEAALRDFVENCDSVLFTMEDLEGFDKEMARYARNACYAHGGRKFKDKELQAYYEQFDWYVPTYEPSEFDNYYDEAMNYYQRKNLDLVRTYEKEMGFG